MEENKKIILEEKIRETYNYSIIALVRQQDVLYYEEFGSYEGEWILLSKDDDFYYLYKDWYGSCSGCDNLQAEFDWDEQMTFEKVLKFAQGYQPFLKVSKLQMKMLKENDSIRFILPLNLRRSSDIDYNEVTKKIMEVI